MTRTPVERYGMRTRLVMIVAGSTVGITAHLVTRGMPAWPGEGIFVAILMAGWSVLLLLLARTDTARQRRYNGLRRARHLAERLVIYDRETSFYADWYFRLRLQEELVRPRRFGQACSLLLVESARGRLGPEGEKELFECLTQTFRQTDLVAHLGSLRFAVLLPNTDAAGAIIARARLLRRLPPGHVETGKASYPEDGSDWRALLAAAGASSNDFYGPSARAWNPESDSRFVRESHESAA